MTTEERLENLERELARAKRINRWVLAAVAVGLGLSVLAGALGPRTAGAQGTKAAAPESQGLPRYQIAVCDNLTHGASLRWGGPLVLDTYTGDIYMVMSSADVEAWKKGPSTMVDYGWYKWLGGPPR